MLTCSSVDQLHVPYIFPQESGGRADVQWASFLHASTPKTLPLDTATNLAKPDSLYGLMALAMHKSTSLDSSSKNHITGSQAAETHNSADFQVGCDDGNGAPSFALVSALPYSAKQLHRAGHQFELQPDGDTHVLLDAFHMGVGGDDSWSPSVHTKYLLPPAVFRFGVAFVPILDR